MQHNDAEENRRDEGAVPHGASSGEDAATGTVSRREKEKKVVEKKVFDSVMKDLKKWKNRARLLKKELEEAAAEQSRPADPPADTAEETHKLSEDNQRAEQLGFVEEIARLKRELTDTRLRNKLLGTAAKAGAINPEMVTEFLAPRYTLSERGSVVAKDASHRDAVSGGDSVESFLKENDWLLKASMLKGSGSNSQAKLDVFTRENITNPEFYEQHREEINKLADTGKLTHLFNY